MMDDDECGAVGGMAGTGNGSTRRNSTPLTPCPPGITHDLTDWPTRWEAGSETSRIPHFLDNLEPYGPAALYPHKDVVVLIFVTA
jgi:hypothetical protein